MGTRFLAPNPRPGTLRFQKQHCGTTRYYPFLLIFLISTKHFHSCSDNTSGAIGFGYVLFASSLDG